MVAGLETPTDGEIRVKGKRVNETPIHKRNLGLVFQNYALFPHKTIFDNVAFGLHYRNVDKNRSEEHTSELQSLMRISYAVFCLKKKKKSKTHTSPPYSTSNQDCLLIHEPTTLNELYHI